MMKARGRERGRYTAAGGETYVFRLFVAGSESNSTQASGNLARLCEEHLKGRDRKSTRLNSSHVRISYAVFCLKKKKNTPKSPRRGKNKDITTEANQRRS